MGITFIRLLNRPSNVNDNAINRLPQIECNVLLDDFPVVMEIRKAFQHLSSGKAPSANAIPAEFYIAGGLSNGRETDRFVSMHVEEGGYPTRIQGFIHNLSIQTERKSSRL